MRVTTSLFVLSGLTLDLTRHAPRTAAERRADRRHRRHREPGGYRRRKARRIESDESRGQGIRATDGDRPHRGQQAGDRARDEARREAGRQSDGAEPEEPAAPTT